MVRKCELLFINRSNMYYAKKEISESDVIIMNEMCDIYMKCPFYGYRRMTVILKRNGYVINHKRARRLMKMARLKAVYPLKKTITKNKEHIVYPYLLKNMTINRPNQVWCVDITYIKIKTGFIYLVCIIDAFSRKIMGWSISIFLDTQSSLEALHMAITQAIPEYLNSDQGVQYTSRPWTEELQKLSIQISMVGKGRWADNPLIERFWRTIKYEHVHLHSFDTVQEARVAIVEFINFYNQDRPHQAIGYKTPNEYYNENIAKQNKSELSNCTFFPYQSILSKQLNFGARMQS